MLFSMQQLEALMNFGENAFPCHIFCIFCLELNGDLISWFFFITPPVLISLFLYIFCSAGFLSSTMAARVISPLDICSNWWHKKVHP